MDDIEQNGRTPEIIDDFEYEGDGTIGTILGEAIQEKKDLKAEKYNKQKADGNKKRDEEYHFNRSIGIRPPKQSKYSATGASLSSPTSDRSVWIVLNKDRTVIYKDSADVSPRFMMGIPAYGKQCIRNAYEHLINFQNKLKETRDSNPPKWVIISTDTAMLMDRNLITRLEELRPTTAVAGAYGFQQIRQHGKWYQLTQADMQLLRGCYIQGNMDNIEWDFILGEKFRDSSRYQILIVHGPFIAVRGELFKELNFEYLAKNSKEGYWHYMADISMECHKRNLMCATIKTNCMQFDKLSNHEKDEDFIHDQALFTSKWQDYLPASIQSHR